MFLALPPSDQPARTSPVPLTELALSFLKLGTIAFGGPAAHIAMMEDEFVRKRKWISQAEFLDRLAAANLIPGPSSTEVAIFICGECHSCSAISGEFGLGDCRGCGNRMVGEINRRSLKSERA